MRPKKSDETVSQGDLYRSQLSSQLNRKHELFVLAAAIDWVGLDEALGERYVSERGRPALPTRLLVGLHYLKYAYDESDESVSARWVENPYWQHFCGYDTLQHDLPMHPTSMTRWRQRMGPERIEALLQQTVAVASRQGHLNKNALKRVNVDTTVQPKAVAFPTDARLADTARRALVHAARKRGIELRQSYERVGKRALFEHSRYARARQFKRANRHLRKLRTYLGRVLRDIERKCPEPDPGLRDLMHRCRRIHEQRRNDRNKIYSVHAPEVECIAKGKAHKKYEFGVKVSMATTSKDNWVVGAQALHGAPFDGHTLVGQLQQVKRLSGQLPGDAFVDRGYRGAPSRVAEAFTGKVTVHLPKAKKKVPRRLYRWMRRRSAIEPVIGHTKSDHRMERNPLKGVSGDQTHALLCAAGFNFRKLLRLAALWRAWFRFQALFASLRSRQNPLQISIP